MLSAEELSGKIAALADQRVSLNDFEDWFRVASRDVHQWGDPNLNSLVDAVESLFSERYFEGLDDQSMRLRLQEEMRQFARPFVSRLVSRCEPVADRIELQSRRVAVAAAVALALYLVVGSASEQTASSSVSLNLVQFDVE